MSGAVGPMPPPPRAAPGASEARRAKLPVVLAPLPPRPGLVDGPGPKAPPSRAPLDDAQATGSNNESAQRRARPSITLRVMNTGLLTTGDAFWLAAKVALLSLALGVWGGGVVLGFGWAFVRTAWSEEVFLSNAPRNADYDYGLSMITVVPLGAIGFHVLYSLARKVHPLRDQRHITVTMAIFSSMTIMYTVLYATGNWSERYATLLRASHLFLYLLHVPVGRSRRPWAYLVAMSAPVMFLTCGTLVLVLVFPLFTGLSTGGRMGFFLVVVGTAGTLVWRLRLSLSSKALVQNLAPTRAWTLLFLPQIILAFLVRAQLSSIGSLEANIVTAALYSVIEVSARMMARPVEVRLRRIRGKPPLTDDEMAAQLRVYADALRTEMTQEQGFILVSGCVQLMAIDQLPQIGAGLLDRGDIVASMAVQAVLEFVADWVSVFLELRQGVPVDESYMAKRMGIFVEMTPQCLAMIKTLEVQG